MGKSEDQAIYRKESTNGQHIYDKMRHSVIGETQQKGHSFIHSFNQKGFLSDYYKLDYYCGDYFPSLQLSII